MQEVFEKIIEQLEEQKVKCIYDSSSIIGEKNGLRQSKSSSRKQSITKSATRIAESEKHGY